MKKFIVFAVILIVAASAVSVTAQVYDPEKAAIKKAIHDFYMEGQAKSDPQLFDQLFHESWHYYSHSREGGIRITDKATYLGYYDPANANPNREWKLTFLTVEVDGNIGFARFKLSWGRGFYIDYFSLMKLDGKWWVVHKMSG